MTAHLRLIIAKQQNRSVPVRPPNSDLRTREYLTPKEIEELIKAAKDGRGASGRDAGAGRLPAWPAGFGDLRLGMVAGGIRPIAVSACPPG